MRGNTRRTWLNLLLIVGLLAVTPMAFAQIGGGGGLIQRAGAWIRLTTTRVLQTPGVTLYDAHASAIAIAHGSATEPSIRAAGFPFRQTGWFFPTTDVMAWSLAGTEELRLIATALQPGANDGLALGTSLLGFSDLFLASGGVINWANGNVTLTHATGQVTLNDAALFGWGDVLFARDAANIFAQRNGTNAQTFRLYNTFTSATDYERLNVSWSANVLRIATVSDGAGAARVLEIGVTGDEQVRFIQNNVTAWFLASGASDRGDLFAQTDNTFDIGSSGASRPRDVYIADQLVLGSAAASGLAGSIFMTGVTNANLGTPTDGTVVYCSDCTIANPCAGAGTGALAKRLNGTWVCN